MTWADEVLAGHPFVVAHRGASAARPEHTLAAYDLALKEGADGVECDVRLTRDRRSGQPPWDPHCLR